MPTQAITEANDQATIASWYADAKQMTAEKLPEFIRRLTQDYDHDYGTIVHACAAAACAAAHAVDRSPTGGITGFQAGAIMWEFMGHWNGIEAPAWLSQGKNLLYPQYAESFTTISPDTWKHTQEEAAKKIAEAPTLKGTDHAVFKHWESIVAGVVPFGLKVRKS